jgi:hypothetical protein
MCRSGWGQLPNGEYSGFALETGVDSSPDARWLFKRLGSTPADADLISWGEASEDVLLDLVVISLVSQSLLLKKRLVTLLGQDRGLQAACDRHP